MSRLCPGYNWDALRTATSWTEFDSQRAHLQLLQRSPSYPLALAVHASPPSNPLPRTRYTATLKNFPNAKTLMHNRMNVHAMTTHMMYAPGQTATLEQGAASLLRFLQSSSTIVDPLYNGVLQLQLQ